MAYDNSNRGAVWGNDKREKDSHPHFKGQANIDGVEYYVSAWKRGEGAKPNSPALSMSFVKVDDVKSAAISQANNTMQAPPPPPPAVDQFDDDFPY